MNSEYDPDVIHRAALNADAPYDQRTCERYPWAAAARIRYLECLQGRDAEQNLRDRAMKLVDELAPITRRDKWWSTEGPYEIIEKHLGS